MSQPERCPQGTCYTTYSRLHPYRKDVQHARTDHCAYWRESVADTERDRTEQRAQDWWADFIPHALDAFAVSETSQLRDTNRELNRRNQALEHALARESGKGSWYSYYKAALDLFAQEGRKTDELRQKLNAIVVLLRAKCSDAEWEEMQKYFNREMLDAVALRKDLMNLLAVIHRDGGQYAGEHGTHKASEDAEAIVVALRQRVEEMERFTRQVSKSMDRTGSYSYVHERIVAEARRLLEGR